MRFVVACSAMVIATHCACAQNARAASEALNKLAECFERGAQWIDDARLDPVSVARGLLAPCLAERERFIVAASEPGTTDAVILKRVDDRRERDIDMAVSIILKHRVGAKPPPPKR